MFHPKLVTGRVGIYARYSSDLQSENSIEDQARRARDEIARAGGDPSKAIVFPDFAISGSSLERPGLDALMTAVAEKRIDIIVTEDVSRISRDMGDAAMIFKRLAFAGVPLISLSDGIDTSSKSAKPLIAVRAMLAEMYIDDLRDKTLRGLEGRMLAGFCTGSVPYGFRTVATTDAGGRVAHKILIDHKEAAIVRRIFELYLKEWSLRRIARALNIEGIPSPRAGSKHKRFGWGTSTIRAILYNERYIGVWRFKETQWIKVPGTNKRVPRKRPVEEVMRAERPELRIIDQEIWDEVSARLAATARTYSRKGKERDGKETTPGRQRGWNTRYLLSGIAVCADCGFPLTIYGGAVGRYYRCYTNYSKGTCPNDLRVREADLRKNTLHTIRHALQSKEGIEFVRKEMAGLLGEHSRKLDAELKETRERLKRTEERIAGLIGFIADGDRSTSVVSALHDLEVQAKNDRVLIERLEIQAAEPLRLPSLEEITRGVFDFDRLLKGDVTEARLRLRRWLDNGEVKIARAEGGYSISGSAFPMMLAAENANSQRNQVVPSGESKVRSGGRI